jgi:glutamate/tyrosine decarboxylase-like PLP-dependent enzyme
VRVRSRDDDPRRTFADRWLNDGGLLVNDDVAEVARAAYAMFFTKNNSDPAVRELECDVIDMSLDLLGGGADAVGTVTSGGTESLFIAVKAAHTRAARVGRLQVDPEIVVPETAYAAFEKIASFVPFRVVRTPVTADYAADLDAMRAAVTEATFMVVGSVPDWSFGVCDPVRELGQLALERDFWLHVDACVGGFLAPFFTRLGEDIPEFDLTVPGVTSLSADLHKFGFTAKGASTILFPSGEARGFHVFEFDAWPAGYYRSPGVTGTRPGGAVAAAWAVMRFLGIDGYTRLAEQTLKAKKRLLDSLVANELTLLGRPQLATVSFAADDFDVRAAGVALREVGWSVNMLKSPPAIQLVLGPFRDEVVTALLEDLAEVVRVARTAARRDPAPRVVYCDEMLLDEGVAPVES